MRAKITKQFVETAAPQERDLLVWDTELAGFGLKVTPKGKRVYILQYRARGRVRRYTIGSHGQWTPHQARQEVARLRGEIARGQDPADAKITNRKAATVAQLCDRYLEEHVELHNKPSTAKEFRRLVENRIKPSLGAMKAKDVARHDVMRLHRSMRNTPRQANLVLAVLSKIFSLAELWDLRPDNSNPSRLIKRYPENQRERFLSEDELGRLGAALSVAERDGSAHPSTIAALRLLALTGCRLSEVLKLKWEHVDFDASALNLPDAKAGGRVHPIGAPALSILADIPPVEGSSWVLNGVKSGSHISVSAVEKAWKRLCERAKLSDCRIHDLRHTVGTYAGQTGANAFLVRDKLGHKTLAMTGRYVSRDADPLRQLSETVESRIEAAMRQKSGVDIVEIGARRRASRSPTSN